MEQLILHLFGDYVTQSDWMALNKRKDSWPAMCHAAIYSIPFVLLTRHAPNPGLAWTVIIATHFLIDRLGLARYMVWAKNWLGPWRKETMTQALERGKLEGRVSSPVFAEGELAEFMDDFRSNPRIIPPNLPWAECALTGYDPSRPAWLAAWLLIAADNTLHLAINYAALRWL